MYTTICEGLQAIGLVWAWPLVAMLLVRYVWRTIQEEMKMAWIANQQAREDGFDEEVVFEQDEEDDDDDER